MVCKKVIIKNKSGLHARPASVLVRIANEFKSDIYIKKDSATVSAKSIMGVLVLGVSKGDEIIIQADGSDEVEALEAIVKMIKLKFNEED
ncbi:MAG: HPr family phosphocarrier protein [Eubacteriaceae bacterium]